MPTIANDASSWPSSISRSRTSCATSASVRPTSRPAAIAATTRSAACAAIRSSAISSGSLIARSSPSTRASPRRSIERSSAARRAWNASRWLAHKRSDTAKRTSRPGDGARPDNATAYGSSVSSQVPIGTSTRVPACAAAPLEARHDKERRAARATTSSVRRSSGIAAVAGEVLEVRAHADEHGLEPALRRERGGAPADRGTRRLGSRAGVGIVIQAPPPRRRSEPCAERPRTVLEQLAVGEDAIGTGRQRTPRGGRGRRAGRPRAPAALPLGPSRSRRPRRRRAPSGRRSPDRRRASRRPMRGASGRVPARRRPPRSASVRRVDQIRSSARDRDAHLSRALPRDGGTRRGP